ncbi:MAG: ESX-1 secretion-associated protein [Mycobacterium sp.]|nr:ESX-1 secretion-associated protein [Mycobacterium sp.]
MADIIRVDLENLREAATRHGEVADQLRVVPDSHDAIQQSLDSLGPIFAELREAGRELLEQRRLCYQEQADEHSAMADSLRASATYWEEHEDERAAAMRALSDDQR